jgi:hypothetical protein
MNEPESFSTGSRESEIDSFVDRLRGWWRLRTSEEHYLATATDVAELERRMRELERAKGGPVFSR